MGVVMGVDKLVSEEVSGQLNMDRSIVLIVEWDQQL